MKISPFCVGDDVVRLAAACPDRSRRPALPIVSSTFPSGLNLKTWCPTVAPGAGAVGAAPRPPLAAPPPPPQRRSPATGSSRHLPHRRQPPHRRLPRRRPHLPAPAPPAPRRLAARCRCRRSPRRCRRDRRGCRAGNAIMPAPKLLTSLPDSSNRSIGSSGDILPVVGSATQLFAPQRSATQMDRPSRAMSTALVEPHVRPSGQLEVAFDGLERVRRVVGRGRSALGVSDPSATRHDGSEGNVFHAAKQRHS